jgi:hypothetical protein
MKRLLAAAISLFILPACSSRIIPPKTETNNTALLSNFETPDNVQLSVYWYWLSDNISKEGVEKDLLAMKQVGISRAFIGNIDVQGPVGKVRIFTPEWWSILHAALKKAGELNIEIGMFNSPGWSQSGGPWIKKQQSMRYLSSIDTIVNGPVLYKSTLPKIDNGAQDLKVIAYPIRAQHFQTHTWQVTKLEKAKALLDMDIPGGTPMSSLVLQPDKRIRTRAKLYYKKEKEYLLLSDIDIDRSNMQLNVGFDTLAPVVISIPAVNTTSYRLEFTEPGEAKIQVTISAQPKVERYPEKTLAKMFQTPLPLWDTYLWRQQPEIQDNNLVVPVDKVVDITSKYKDGILEWNIPAGNWKIQRMIMRSTGVTNGPATPEGTGLEVDKMNKDHVKFHFDAFIGEILRRVPAEDRKTFKVVVADSYETGGQNWTDDMVDRFQQMFKYNPIPFLPVLQGTVVGSPDISDRFLWDLRQLIAHRVAYDYVGTLREESHKHGLTTWLENYGHWGFPAEFLKYGGQSDELGGEFWNEGTLGSIECRAASSAAHIYGKTKVSAESFTAAGNLFQRYPALLKKRGDWSFTEGINNTLLHVYIHQPDERMPGMNAWFGTEFNRHNTWFKHSKTYMDYLKRCNYLLQQGLPVNDVAYFIGEDVPKMTGVVNPPLPKGYQFDYINAEVILNRLSVKNGRLTLPDGMSYRMLVLPQLTTMRPELLAKISQLVKEGAVILGTPPERSPGLQNFPAADKEVKELAATLWGDVDGNNKKSRSFGKGRVMAGLSMEEAFSLLNVKPDFLRNTAAEVLFTHRTTNRYEIYFVTNQSDTVIHFIPSFRDGKGQPYWFDATTGKRRRLEGYAINSDGTTIPLKLEKNESCFIIFDKAEHAVPSDKNNFPEPASTIELKKPWMVHFDSTMQGSRYPVVFSQLIDWRDHANDSIKNYSGAAVYKTQFEVEKLPVGKTFINLNQVNVMATVMLNKKELGTVWTYPYKVDASAALKSGTNELEIIVVNTWVNRLIGDNKLPTQNRKTWTAVNPVTKEQPYSPSGLLGPVQLETY